MSGPEHFTTAEQLQAEAQGQRPIEATTTLLNALVHATLAQAAATAMATAAEPGNMPSADRDAWHDAAATSSSYGAGR